MKKIQLIPIFSAALALALMTGCNSNKTEESAPPVDNTPAVVETADVDAENTPEVEDADADVTDNAADADADAADATDAAQ